MNLAEAILMSHIFFLSGFTVAPFVLNKAALQYYQVAPVVVGASWLLDGGKCIWSDWEFAHRKHECKEHLNLFQTAFKKIGRDITVKQSNRLGWVALGLTMLVTQVRLRR